MIKLLKKVLKFIAVFGLPVVVGLVLWQPTWGALYAVSLFSICIVMWAYRKTPKWRHLSWAYLLMPVVVIVLLPKVGVTVSSISLPKEVKILQWVKDTSGKLINTAKDFQPNDVDLPDIVMDGEVVTFDDSLADELNQMANKTVQRAEALKRLDDAVLDSDGFEWKMAEIHPLPLFDDRDNHGGKLVLEEGLIINPDLPLRVRGGVLSRISTKNGWLVYVTQPATPGNLREGSIEFTADKHSQMVEGWTYEFYLGEAMDKQTAQEMYSPKPEREPEEVVLVEQQNVELLDRDNVTATAGLVEIPIDMIARDGTIIKVGPFLSNYDLKRFRIRSGKGGRYDELHATDVKNSQRWAHIHFSCLNPDNEPLWLWVEEGKDLKIRVEKIS